MTNQKTLKERKEVNSAIRIVLGEIIPQMYRTGLEFKDMEQETRPIYLKFLGLLLQIFIKALDRKDFTLEELKNFSLFLFSRIFKELKKQGFSNLQ